MQEPGQSLTSLGTISGRVQPIETGNDDCFRLYVPLFDAFVDCFIEAALVDVVRGMEGEYVIVAGRPGPLSLNWPTAYSAKRLLHRASYP